MTDKLTLLTDRLIPPNRERDIVKPISQKGTELGHGKVMSVTELTSVENKLSVFSLGNQPTLSPTLKSKPGAGTGRVRISVHGTFDNTDLFGGTRFSVKIN